MPTYNFRNKLTGEITEEWMSIAQRESFLKKNKNMEPYIEDAPSFAYSAPGDFVGKKTDNTWKEVMAKIAEKHPASKLAEEYGPRKTIKQVQTEQVIKKHIKKQQQQRQR